MNSLLMVEGIIKVDSALQISDTYNEKCISFPIVTFDGQLVFNLFVYYRTSMHYEHSQIEGNGIGRSYTSENFDGTEADMWRALVVFLKRCGVLPRLIV